MKINIVSGATGFIGRRLVKDLLKNNEIVWLIIRSNSNSAEVRGGEIFKDLKDKYAGTLKIVEGDVRFKNLGLDKYLNEIKKANIEFWHLAANLSFRKEDKDDIYQTNVDGIKNVIEFTNKYNVRLYYMSTAYVCGNYSGLIKEDELYDTKHRNNYEKSKYIAEKSVREKANNYIIFRPSIVMGDGYEGKAKGCTFGYHRFVYVFYVFKKWLLRKNIKNPLFIFPFPRKSRINFVSLDYVIEAMIKISKNIQIKNKTFHLVNPNPPEFIFLFRILMKDFEFTNIKYFAISKLMFKGLIGLLYYTMIPFRKYLESAKWYMPYIVRDYNFSFENLKKYNINLAPIISEEFFEEVNNNAIKEVFPKIKL